MEDFFIFLAHKVQCVFCGLEEMATAPVDGPGAHMVIHRRPNQDYTSCDHFLTSTAWLTLQGGKNERHRAELLSNFLFHVLGLRLPSEQTYSKMTALVAIFGGEYARSDLHGVLQTVKSTWNGYNKLKRGKECGDTPFLARLPCLFEELPLEIRANFKDSRPGLPEGWPDHRRELVGLALRVPLRETNKAVQQEKAASNVALEVSKALQPYFAYMGMARASHVAEKGLTNLRIFGSPAKPAAPSGQPSLCAESSGQPSGASAAVVPHIGGPAGPGAIPQGGTHVVPQKSHSAGVANTAAQGGTCVAPEMAAGTCEVSGQARPARPADAETVAGREEEVRRSLQGGLAGPSGQF